MSAVVALLTFGLLDSSGTSDNGGIQVGGAIVGFTVSFGLLSGLFRWLRNADAKEALSELQAGIDGLKAKNDELQSQLLRGSSVPDGFVSEVLEHHKLVLARPERYSSRGGVILDIEDRHKPLAETGNAVDVVPARLYVNYTPSTEQDLEAFYSSYAERAKLNVTHEVMSMERTFVGADQTARPALKVSTRSMSRVLVSYDPVLEIPRLTPKTIPRDQWPDTPDKSQIDLTDDELRDTGLALEVCVAIRRAMVVCLHPALRHVFYFVFEDDESDFVSEVEALHRCLRSVRFLS